MLDSPIVWFCAAAVLAFAILSWTSSKDLHRAPGPRGWPFIGNLLEIPAKSPGPFVYFEQLAKKHGEIVRLNMLGDEMLCLNHHEDAEELLEKRSNHFSSRRPLVYSGKYQARGKRLVMLEYGPELRKQRAAFFDMLNPRSVGKYEHTIHQEASKFLYDILSAPPLPTKTGSHNLHEHAMQYIASLVLTLTYGKKNATKENLAAVMPILESVLQDAAPGAHLVDTFPILDQLPDWISPWRRTANAKHEYERDLYLGLVRAVRADMKAGTAQECFTTRLWEAYEQGKFDELTLAYVAGSAFEASIHTTSGTIMWLVMAMTLFPDAQAKAQKEIDDLLLATYDTKLAPPSLDMLTRLPYCVALVKETMRWMPVAPGAFPHASTADETYKGFFIPKGTLVFPNIFAMHRDPRNYVEPDSFYPERFMSSSTDLGGNEVFIEGHWTFGFGRRICPARYLASKMVFIAAIRMLWAFEFRPVLDKHGRPMNIDKFDCPWEPVNEPNPFPVQVVPRSEGHVEKITHDWAEVQDSWKAQQATA